MMLFSLKCAMQNFFGGVNRIFKASLTQAQRCQQYNKIAPYTQLDCKASKHFSDILKKRGYLCLAKKQKHIITQDEAKQVAAALWSIPLCPINRLLMGVALAIKAIAGLRLGEMF